MRKTRLPRHSPQPDRGLCRFAKMAVRAKPSRRPTTVYIYLYTHIYFAPHTHFTPGDSRAVGSRRVFLYADIKKRTDLLILSRVLRGGGEYVYI